MTGKLTEPEFMDELVKEEYKWALCYCKHNYKLQYKISTNIKRHLNLIDLRTYFPKFFVEMATKGDIQVA